MTVLRRLPSALPYAVCAAVVVAVTACSGGGSATAPTTTTSAAGSRTPSRSSSAPPSPSSETTSTSSASAPAALRGASACVRTTYLDLTPQQRVGQLVMIGLDTNAPSTSLDDEIAQHHLGNVIYLGGWTGADRVTETSAHLQQQAGSDATGKVGLLVAADQEGGQIRQLRGAGFSESPAALSQGTWSEADLTRRWTRWAGELKAVGVNLNLAPVADTVPASIGTSNAPIGKWQRQFGSEPDAVARAVAAAVKGMHAGGVETSVKHFPGLGRVRANTDFSSTGITDSVATTKDPHLRPFAAGIDAGTGTVMVSSAVYPKIDPDQRAMFSEKIVTGLLRDQLGFRGVVVTDDLNAAAVTGTSPGQRAVLFIAAGGDLALSGQPADTGPMTTAILSKAKSDKAFGAKVQAAVVRVLTLKDKRGLLPCSG